jgi:Rod binding domain-containing protein
MPNVAAVTPIHSTPEAKISQPRVLQAAREFEAQMMKELLRPMTANTLPGADEDSDGSGSAGALGEFASEALGRALSAQGGFGIADRVIHAFSLSGTGFEPGHQPGTVSPLLHRNRP